MITGSIVSAEGLMSVAPGRASGGTFAQTKGWWTGAQALGLDISPDKTRIAVAGDNGITFLPP